jgi:HTH-type transcriptional regulator/antitoxin HipB
MGLRPSWMPTLIRTPSDLGALIRERRIKLGLDQLSLAKKAGTSRKWLIEVENGKPRAEIGLILRTLRALGVTLTARDATSGVQPKPATAVIPSVDINQIIDSLKDPR